MRFILKRAHRTALIAVAAVAVFASIGAAGASAAATINATTSSHLAGELTSLDVQTTLTGTGNAKRQYGARIILPSAFWINYPSAGTSAQMCPPSAYSSVSTGYTPAASAFNKASCPATAKIGSVQLGSTSGGLYIVNTSPMPQFGVYFDTGTSSPYGRKLGVTWGSNSTDMIVNGLRNASTTGLRIVFDNPLRAGGLPSKFFRFAPIGSAECVSDPQITGNVWTYPTSGFVTTNTAAAPANLTLNGCANEFDATTSTDVAGEQSALTLETGIRADARLYGARFKVPGNIGIYSDGWGPTANWCPPESVSSLSTGITPSWFSFDLAACPNGVPVGTATLGAASGEIYVVQQSPIAEFAIYFDSGVATPYGRRVSVNWGNEGYGETNLMVNGLQGALGEGLTLDFDEHVWRMDPSECEDQNAEAVLRTYPVSGTVSVAQPTLYSLIGISGC